MKKAFRNSMCILLSIVAAGGVVLSFMKDQIIEMLNPLAREIFENIDLDDFDGDATQYLLGQALSDSNGILWLRAYSNGEYNDSKEAFDNTSLPLCNDESSTQALGFLADKIEAMGVEASEIDIKMNSTYSTTKLNGSTVTFAVAPTYSSYSVNGGTDQHRIRWPSSGVDETGWYEYETEYYPIFSFADVFNYTMTDEEWVESEEAYRNYVYNQSPYLDLKNDNVKQSLLDYLEENNLDPKVDDYESIKAVKDHLINNYSYNSSVETPDKYGTSNSAVYFLNSEAKEGDYNNLSWSCCQLFRAAGIPARTCTGYITLASADRTTDVYFLFSHIWTEVYIDGTGWMRIDPSIRNRLVATEEQAALEDAGDTSSLSVVDTQVRALLIESIQEQLPSLLKSYAAANDATISDESINAIVSDKVLLRKILRLMIDAYENCEEPDLASDPDITATVGEYIVSENIVEDVALPDYYFPDIISLNGKHEDDSDDVYVYNEGYLCRTNNLSPVTFGEMYKLQTDGRLAYQDNEILKEDFLEDDETEVTTEVTARWNELKDQPIPDNRTEISTIISSTTKLYTGEALIPDWNAYAKLYTITIHTKEFTDTIQELIHASGIQLEYTDRLVFSSYTTNLSWGSLDYGLDFQLYEDYYIHADLIRNSYHKFDIRFEAAATRQTEINSYYSTSKMTVRDKSQVDTQFDDYKAEDYYGEKTHYLDVTDRYYNITCYNSEEEALLGIDGFSAAELDDYDTETGRKHKIYFNIIPYTLENRMNLGQQYSLTIKSPDIQVSLSELENLDLTSSQYLPEVVYGETIGASGDFAADELTLTPTIDLDSITEAGSYTYSFTWSIDNDSINTLSGFDPEENYKVTPVYGTIKVVK